MAQVKHQRRWVRYVSKWNYSYIKPPTLIPVVLGPNWHTVEYVAHYLNKSYHTIRTWCETGFLIECGYKIMKIDSGSSRRWWIYIPPEQDNILVDSVKVQQQALNIDTLTI